MKLLEDQLRSWQGIAGPILDFVFFCRGFFSGGNVDEKTWVKRSRTYIMIFHRYIGISNIYVCFIRFTTYQGLRGSCPLVLSTCIHRKALRIRRFPTAWDLCVLSHRQEWRTASWESSDFSHTLMLTLSYSSSHTLKPYSCDHD